MLLLFFKLADILLHLKLVILFRSSRYAAYRQFCWWVHARLGKGVRKIIPACVVSKIRETYPSKDGIYTGFKEGDMVSETRCSWVGDIEE